MNTSLFDNIPERRATACYKWDKEPCGDDIIQLGVADMDFVSAPAVLEAVRRRAEHGIYGYTIADERFYDAIIRWHERRHAWKIDRESILYTTGVVPAFSAIIQALTQPGDQVVFMTPAYNCFFSSVRNAGCEASCSPLVCGSEGRWEIDFVDLETRLAADRARVLLFCSPHNPTGRVWSLNELAKVAELCEKYDVVLLSDEIHCEVVRPGLKHIPMATVSSYARDKGIFCISPSKGFNLGGLHVSAIVCNDSLVRRKIDRQININETCDINPFGLEAVIASYNEGEQWLDAMREYVWGNFRYMKDFCQTHFGSTLPLADLEGTYLAWMDCRALGIGSERLVDELVKEVHIHPNGGNMYGGDGFLRWNLATSRARVEEAMRRFLKYIQTLQQ